MLEQEAKVKAPTQWLTDMANASGKGQPSGPKPRFDASNAVNILVGSDEIAVNGILNECTKYGWCPRFKIAEDVKHSKSLMGFLLGIPAYAIVKPLSNSGTKAYGYMFAAVTQYVSALLTRSCWSAADNALSLCELQCINGQFE